MRKIILSMICLIGFSVQAQTITVNDARTATQNLGSPNATITVTKAGSIRTTTLVTYGILVISAATNAIITNNGTITTVAPSTHGIFSQGANTIITHSGTIAITGRAAHGIHAEGADSTITVSGRISATGANSFAVNGSTAITKQTLNLEGDYDIANGDIDLGGGIDTVNIDGIGAGTATSIVFHNVENIDYGMNPRLNVMGTGTIKTLTIDRTPTPTATVLLNNNGCTLNANTDKKPFDPILPLLALLAGGYLLNRKLKYY